MAEMEKDGTYYLCQIQFTNNAIEYIVLFWGEPNGFSSGESETWVTNGGFAPRIKSILSFIECEKALGNTVP